VRVNSEREKMSTDKYIQAASKFLNEAILAEEEGRVTEAVQHYTDALAELYTALCRETRDDGKRFITYHTSVYLDRIELLNSYEDIIVMPSVPARKPQPEAIMQYEQTHESISTTTMTGNESTANEQPLTGRVHTKGAERMCDVIGMDAVKELLNTAIILPDQIPQVFTGSRVAPKALLMYGPSGVGKTLIIKALANECNRALFQFTAADIFERWVGSSERNVKMMFETVRAARPAILFLDEIDALCKSRDSHDSSSNDVKPLNEMLIELDGLGSDMHGILVVGATNRPEALDAGVLSRFDRKIYVPLPDSRVRYSQLANLLKKNEDDVGTSLGEQELLDLASELDYYSGRDIARLVEAAQNNVLQQISHATHFKRATKRDGTDVMVPCAPDTPGALVRSYMELTPEHRLLIAAPMLTLPQLRLALALVKPVVDSDRIIEFEEWTRNHGQHSTADL
jgi:vacuolar protein-sorting-associated protein 4